MKLSKLILVTVLTISGVAHAAMTQEDVNFYTLKKVEVREITVDAMNFEQTKLLVDEDLGVNMGPGEVIAIARELVALGEEVYTLVNKGRPNVTNTYAPISILPKGANGEAVEMLDMENWKRPSQKSYSITYKNLLNMSVIDFRFSVMWSHGGTHEGKGAYITGAQIIPAANVMWGFDFNATMKLASIQNNGTRENPVAGATLILEHTASNMLRSSTRVEKFFIDGRGGFQAY